MSQNDMPRAQFLLKRMLKKGASVDLVLREVTKVVQGKYQPKAFKDDESTMDMAKLVVAFGGPRLLYALQKFKAFPSISTVKRLSDQSARFIVSPAATIQDDIVRHNLEAFALNPKRKEAAKFRLRVLMTDDINVDANLAPSSTTFQVLGFGCESDFSGISLSASSVNELEAMKSAKDQGKLRLAQELTVYAIAGNDDENYSTDLVGAQGTCRKGSSHKNVLATLQCIFGEWQQKAAARLGDITTIAKDGAALMNLAAWHMCTTDKIDRKSDVGRRLFGDDGSGLLLYPDYCGGSPDNPLVDSCDDKHVLKRWRMAVKRLTARRVGMRIGNLEVTREDLTQIWLEVEWYSPTAIENMFGEAGVDAQNVPAATKLLLAVSRLRELTRNELTQKRQQAKMLLYSEHELQQVLIFI